MSIGDFISIRGRGLRAALSRKNSLLLANALPASPNAPSAEADAPTYPDKVFIASASPDATTPHAWKYTYHD